MTEEYDFYDEEGGWQDKRGRAQQNSFSVRAYKRVNPELCLVTTSSYDIVDQRTETESERRDRENGVMPSSERELPQSVKQAAIGGSQSALQNRRGSFFVSVGPPRHIDRGDWLSYSSRPGDSSATALDRATYHRRSFLDAMKADISDRPRARRPYDGTLPRPGSPARLSVVTYDGKLVPLIKAPSGSTKYYTDFTLSTWQYSPTERQQITESFGVDFLKVFGKRPDFVSFGGILVDTPDFNWKSAFLHNWDTTLRATRLVELNARVVITVEDLVMEGYFLKLNLSKQAGNPKIVGFQASFYAKSIQITDPNIISSDVGVRLQAFREEARQQEKERLRNSVRITEAASKMFDDIQKLAGKDRDKVTRRNPNNRKPSLLAPIAFSFTETSDPYAYTSQVIGQVNQTIGAVGTTKVVQDMNETTSYVNSTSQYSPTYDDPTGPADGEAWTTEDGMYEDLQPQRAGGVSLPGSPDREATTANSPPASPISEIDPVEDGVTWDNVAYHENDNGEIVDIEIF